MAVIHAKVSAVSDGGDSSLVQPTDWNAGHTINDIIPAADSTYKLGASGTAWTNVHTEVVSFPATAVLSSGANDLDWYSEGTWTPALTFATAGDLSVTYTTQQGLYTRVGRAVHITGLVVTATFTHTTASGNLRITGLPFAVGAQRAEGFGQIVPYAGGSLVFTWALAVQGATYMEIDYQTNAGIYAISTTSLPTATNVQTAVGLTYFV